MQTPSQTARELVDKFKPHADWNNEYGSQEQQANVKHAKACALIAAKLLRDESESQSMYHRMAFYQQVVREIENLDTHQPPLT